MPSKEGDESLSQGNFMRCKCLRCVREVSRGVLAVLNRFFIGLGMYSYKN